MNQNFKIHWTIGWKVFIRPFQACARHVSTFRRWLVFSLRRYCSNLSFSVETSLQIELCLASADNHDRTFVSSLWPWYPRVDILCGLLQCEHVGLLWMIPDWVWHLKVVGKHWAPTSAFLGCGKGYWIGRFPVLKTSFSATQHNNWRWPLSL